MTTIGLISPGEMGASVGAAANMNHNRVIWAGEDRSEASHARAQRAGIEDCGNLTTIADNADFILSICPPHDAESVAISAAGLSFKGIFVDCNAIAPQKSRRLSDNFEETHYVDASIVGGPAWNADAGTRLYLSGEKAETVAELFHKSPLHVSVISDEVGAASAMKMVFAAYTKGSTALLTAILAVAEREGVRDVLERQWGASFTDRTHNQLVTNSSKAWRFSGEMLEIAQTFEDAGFPGGFHEAAAQIFDQLIEYKDGSAEDITALLQTLVRSS